MRLGWVSYASLTPCDGGGMTSGLASARYRMLIPSAHMKGFQHSYLYHAADTVSQELKESLRNCEVVIISKSIKSPSGYEALAEFVKTQTKARLIFDICDNHFPHPVMGAHYRRMIGHSDRVTCNTPEMAQIVLQETGQRADIVTDPFEWDARTPSTPPVKDALRLAWFGSATNLASLNLLLPAMQEWSRLMPVRLEVVTLIDDALRQTIAALNQQNPECQILLTPWTPESAMTAITAAHAVTIPNVLDEKSQTKSPNRMIEALQLGRPVLASPIPAYRPFTPWTWQGENFVEGFEWRRHPAINHSGLIGAAQEYIAMHYAPPVVAKAWEKICESVTR